MYPVFSFDIRTYYKRVLNYFSSILLFAFGLLCGNKFNLSLGEGIYLNGTFTIGFMLGLLSLLTVFIATIIGSRLLFKEWDNHFDAIVFSTPVTEKKFIRERFASFWCLTFLSFVFIVFGFIVGQNLRAGTGMSNSFSLLHYLYPLALFGVINSLLVCSVLFFIAFTTKNRMLVVMGGLLLYVVYMIALIYSNAPFIANAIPQSEMARKISAIADPFGISSYFYSGRHFTSEERNTTLVPLSGSFLWNRLSALAISLFLIMYVYRFFNFTTNEGRFKKRQIINPSLKIGFFENNLSSANRIFNLKSFINSLTSFVKVDLTYIFKSVVMPAACVMLLFYLGMGMHAEIEKGIRIPEQYASSGLMAQVVNRNFYLMGVLLTVFYANDICWRSKISGFSQVENSTYFGFSKVIASWTSITILITFFSFILIAEGVLFQSIYGYTHFDIDAYTGVLLFNSVPLMLLAGFLVFINSIIKNKYLALGVTMIIALFVATPFAKKIIIIPAFRFFSGFNGVYSDFCGYGDYSRASTIRLLFGACTIGTILLIHQLTRNRKRKIIIATGILLLIATAWLSGKKLTRGYINSNDERETAWSSSYEKKYRSYQNTPQPTITDVETKIDLFPLENSYSISGTYSIRNLSDTVVNKILFNFAKDLKIEEANFYFKNQSFHLSNIINEVLLNQPMMPNDEAKLSFSISYRWFVANEHAPFNAIIRNGSFMRISRFYPVIGYQAQYEITNESRRKHFALGAPTLLKKPEDPGTIVPDYINLDMTISTTADQTAIGTGELLHHWTNANRNYFHFRSGQAIPFRFAVSSAEYALKTTDYNGIKISVYYHPKHFENVENLITNAKQTLDYCTKNFAPYLFTSLTFSEVSSFSAGFNATAYPAVIFMTENMAFHSNLEGNKQQDVINELAGHEISHLWWGNNSQMSPDEREGSAMLSESFAMYTQMMIYKKLYGKEKMLERLEIHREIYESEKGYSKEQPLYKVTPENSHISYSKGAIVMVTLAQLIGEEKVNEVLKSFLMKNRYPKRPRSIDFLNELYQMTDRRYHRQIEQMFTRIENVKPASD